MNIRRNGGERKKEGKIRHSAKAKTIIGKGVITKGIQRHEGKQDENEDEMASITKGLKARNQGHRRRKQRKPRKRKK